MTRLVWSIAGYNDTVRTPIFDTSGTAVGRSTGTPLLPPRSDPRTGQSTPTFSRGSSTRPGTSWAGSPCSWTAITSSLRGRTRGSSTPRFPGRPRWSTARGHGGRPRGRRGVLPDAPHLRVGASRAPVRRLPGERLHGDARRGGRLGPVGPSPPRPASCRKVFPTPVRTAPTWTTPTRGTARPGAVSDDYHQ